MWPWIWGESVWSEVPVHIRFPHRRQAIVDTQVLVPKTNAQTLAVDTVYVDQGEKKKTTEAGEEEDTGHDQRVALVKVRRVPVTLSL